MTQKKVTQMDANKIKEAMATVVSPEKIKGDVNKVLNIFLKQEAGNRITAFNMSGLATMLNSAVDGKVQFEAPAEPKEKSGE